MLNLPAATPPGALDLTGDAAQRRRALQRAAVSVLERAGYEELLPPTFEYEDTFLRAGGAGVAERLLRFPDRDGRILALRYDFTSSVARIAATTFAGARLPLRLCYSGRVYRQEPERGGRPREMLQVGAELLGEGDLERGRGDRAAHHRAHSLGRAGGLPGEPRPRRRARAGARRAGGAGTRAGASVDRPEGPRRVDARARRPHGRRGEPAHDLPFVIGRRDALEAALGTAPRDGGGGLAAPAGPRRRARARRAEPRGVRSGRGAGTRLLHRRALRGVRRGHRPGGGRRGPLRRADGPLRAADAGGGRLASISMPSPRCRCEPTPGGARQGAAVRAVGGALPARQASTRRATPAGGCSSRRAIRGSSSSS